MLRRPRTSTFAALVVATMTLGVLAAPAVAQGGGGGGSGGNGADDVQVTKFAITLTSQQTVLHEVGPDGQHTYGWNQLVGTGSSDSGDIAMELLGNVQYTDGEGPFFGSVTLTFASLAEVGFSLTGEAAKDAGGTTNLTGRMKVIGGTGALSTVKGKGSFTGVRRDDLGGAIELVVTTRLRGVDIG